MAGYKSKKKAAVDKVAGGIASVVKGSHLTVTTFEDGSTKLEWDDEALMQDVQDAIASVSVTPTETKPKKTRKAKA